ncbi:uncharacterized protein [Choristoneura fumiferana]|uniref:uncharacterized protein n=1 Tax=Choristoneura fumiferana TaxID=7141 RepID=UPI003D15A40E
MCLYCAYALPRGARASRRGVLPTDEADHVESLAGRRLVPTRLAAHVHPRRLLHQFRYAQAIPSGISVCGGGRPEATVPRHCGRVPRQPPEDAALRRPQECTECRGGDGSVCGSVGPAATVPAAGWRRARRQYALRHRRPGHRGRAVRPGTYNPTFFCTPFPLLNVT